MADELIRWHLVLLVLVVTVHDAVSQQSDTPCTESSPSCVSLESCPELRRLFPLRTVDDIRRMNRLTCGFDGPRRPKVCCPNRPPEPSTPSAGESLLPKSCGHAPPLDKIFGGFVAPLGSYPWMAVLGFRKVGSDPSDPPDWECGGSLINSRYVLTAAHCTDRNVPLIAVRLGESDLSRNLDCDERGSACASPPQDFFPETIIPHPSYRRNGFFSDDLALIRLDRPAEMTAYVQPVCLPAPGQSYSDIAGNRDVTVTGWGDMEIGVRSQQLLYVILPLVPAEQCKQAADYSSRLISTGGQVCLGGRKNQDSCNKDSGGPAVITQDIHGPPYVQVGIVSYGPRECGTFGVPGVYTDVAAYRSWIVNTLQP